MRRFTAENNIQFTEKNKILVTSRMPTDNDYVTFMNKLDIGVGLVKNSSLEPVGADFGLASI
jgi:hypothetical protein